VSHVLEVCLFAAASYHCSQSEQLVVGLHETGARVVRCYAGSRQVAVLCQ
jgi:hypothetical protein